MRFTKEFKEKIKGDRKKFALSELFGVSHSSFTRWLNLKNSDKLTTIERIKILTEFTGLSQDEIFEDDNN